MELLKLLNSFIAIVSSSEFLQVERIAILGDEVACHDFLQNASILRSAILPVTFITCSRYFNTGQGQPFGDFP